jgi:hypothetical protein
MGYLLNGGQEKAAGGLVVSYYLIFLVISWLSQALLLPIRVSLALHLLASLLDYFHALPSPG